ncbi:MAG: radical SAM protein [Deltaproteobacteria bacterium]|nr:radical SAM protein [Deltaproteobacteria bacterium]
MAYEPVERHRKIEKVVIQERVGGDLKKYYRFRRDHWYGGVITADCAGCGLTCKYCWVRKESILEGREGGEFLKPEEVAHRVLELMREKKINQGRISGGEPTIGRRHLIQFLNVLQRRRVRFILETNGILIGEDESYAQDLALYPFLHVRVSLKGCTENEFARLTGADPRGFHLQLNALRNLKKAGVSAHPSVMLSFSGREEIDRLYSTIWKIDPILHSEIEKEEVILYPYVVEKLKRAGLEYYSGHIPEKKEGKRQNGKKTELERPRIEERGSSHGGKAKEKDERTSIQGKDPKIRIKRGTISPKPDAQKVLSDEE